MNKKLVHTLTLGALVTLAAGPHALATDHSGMDHSKMGHGAMAAETPAAGKQAPQPVEIRKAVVSGHTLTYTLIDMKQAMASSSTPMAHGEGQMKSHHLMVYPVRTGSAPVTGGKAGFLVVQPDKTEVRAMAAFMAGGFGADVDLVAKGDYTITAKIVVGDATLVDEFVYTVK
jgi:hypothetical protein